MPRQVDLFSRNLQVSHDPTKQLGMSGSQVQAMLDQLPALEAQALETAVNQILAQIDQLTGLDLVAWAKLLEGDYSGGSSDLLADFTASVNSFTAQFQTLLNSLFAGLGGTGTPTTSGIQSLLAGLNAVSADLENFLATGDWSNLTEAYNDLVQTLIGSGSTVGVLGRIPSSSVTNINQNVQPVSDFPNAAALQGGSGWSQDGTTSYGGTGGSAKYTASGLAGALRGVISAVQPGQVVTPSAQVSWSGLSAASGTHPIQLQLIPYSGPIDAPTPGAPFMVAQVTSPGSSSSWTHLTGNYTVPPSGVTAVQMRLVVTSDAIAGTVWWAACTEEVTGGFLDGMNSDVGDIIASFAPGGTAAQFQTGVSNLLALFGLDSSSIASSTTAATIWNDTITDIIDPLDLLISKAGSDWNSLVAGVENGWNALFGSSAAPSSSAAVQQSAISGLGSVWNALFGTTTPTGSSQVQQSSVNGLQSLWNTIFGTTTPTGGSMVQQSSINGLQSLWNNIFGTTTPTSSTPIQQSAVDSLTNVWTALFGSSAKPTTSSQVQQSAVASLGDAWTALFGSSAQPTTSSLVQQSSVANLTNAWTALFGSGATPTTSSKVQQASVNGLTGIWNALFGTTTPTSSSTLTTAAIPDITATMSSGVTSILNTIGAALGLGSSGNTASGIAAPLATVLGPSQFRAYASTGSGALTGTSTGNPQAFPFSFNVTDYNTGGYSFNASTNTLTIPTDGLYYIKVGSRLTTGQNSAVKIVAPLLYYTPAGGSTGVARVGAGQGFPTSTSVGSTWAYWCADSFTIELDAGDTITPGLIYVSTTGAVTAQGESSGAQTYFEVALIRADP